MCHTQRALFAALLVTPLTLFLGSCTVEGGPTGSNGASVHASLASAKADKQDDKDDKKEEKVEAGDKKRADPLAEIRAFIETQKVDKTKPNWKTQLAMPPKLMFEKGQKIYWNLKTSEGDIVIQLLPDVAPMHVSSTMYLVDLGFYDDLLFHRVIPGFMAQGGCPLGKGHGSPGYSYDGEYDPEVKHDRPGLLSMANTGRPKSDGSQFFLTFVPTPHLNMKHTIFGEVVEGMEVVKTLEKFGTPSGQTSKPIKMVTSTLTVK
jgi:cyclophilin family peptidyl-prolyl cis-trans isomerase